MDYCTPVEKFNLMKKAIYLGELWTEYWCGPILKLQNNYKADLGWLLRAGARFQASNKNAHLLFNDLLGDEHTLIPTTFQEVNSLN